MIKAVIFILPLFFLPWTAEFFEFNKQFLLWLTLPLILILWLAKRLTSGELKIKVNPLNWPVLIFLGIMLASAWFSADRFSSFFGYYGRFSDAWLGLFSLVILYFLLVNTGIAGSAEKIFVLIKLLLYSAYAAAAVSLLAMFGAVKALAGDPFNILASSSFNPAGGSLNSFSVFLAVAAVLAAGLLTVERFKKNERLALIVCLISSLAVLTAINFMLSWILLLMGGVFLLFFHWLGAGRAAASLKNKFMLAPAALMLIAIIFSSLGLFNSFKPVWGANLPREASLDYRTALAVSASSIKNHPILGSGPGLFSRDFSLYRPAEFNKNSFWQIRFDKSPSQILELASAGGIPALLSYLLIISLIIYLNLVLLKKYLTTNRPELSAEHYNLFAVLFSAFVLLFISQLIFPANTALNFIFWLIAGLLTAFWGIQGFNLFKEKVIKFNQAAPAYRLTAAGLFFMAALWLALAVYEIKFFMAEAAAVNGGNREASLIKAAELNPYRPDYKITLAKLYLNQALAEAGRTAAERDNNFIQTKISRALTTGKLAAAAAPASVQAQETLGMIYRDIGPLTAGAEPWAVKSFNQAFALEPTNPILAAELARAYFNDNNQVKAEEYYRVSLELKPDYYGAQFGLAKTYLKQKKDVEALKLLNNLAELTNEPEVFYELGRYYYNRGEIDRAISEFTRVLNLAPIHANSLYSLGIAYEAKGDKVKALNYYEKVLELNPGNAEVEAKLNNLRNNL